MDAASDKHQFDGHSLVLLDGTIIDDDECLISFKDEVLLLLTEDEMRLNDDSGYETTSSPSSEFRKPTDSRRSCNEEQGFDENVTRRPFTNLPVNNLTPSENTRLMKAKQTKSRVAQNDDNSGPSQDANSTNRPNNSPPKTFKNFKVPFDKLRSDVEFEMNGYESKSIEMQAESKKRVRTAVSQRVIGEMRMIGHNAKKRHFERVAIALRDK
ncbi:hypothetical protein QAD02_013317 [Eretmocerus hayati]|uniref:Uncharacterized protein n=1 Tax=Eretmocerus hayati TaxID=131215 RepID=A0ACC2P1S9_9HYME|nr:hypothetical protein QAD02_013317 [Eretmocerus hayati]